jgi:DNA-directed RNA polymerase subunit M/transcription elongation factor TFIIS
MIKKNNSSFNSKDEINKIKLDNNTQNLNPFSHTEYNFVIPNSIDLKNTFIQYAETCIDRAKSQTILSSILMDIDIAIKIELSIFEYALIYCSNNKFEPNYVKPIYQDKLNEILLNLDENKKEIENKTFKTNILSGIIDPSNVAFLSPSQIHPEKWNTILKKKEYMEQREKNIVYSDAYKCFKCGESKCKITQAQTRSADEPMTTFVVCVVCHNTFKFG